VETILVTGAAGFIGFHTAKALLALGHQVVGLDNINDYYDTTLKQDRLAQLGKETRFKFHKMDLNDFEGMQKLFSNTPIDRVVHLAAQAGVRYSLESPRSYIQSNIDGFLNILEICRSFTVKHLVYASSSSVYGSNTKLPFSTCDNVDHPVSLYAATKKSNELMAHSYSHLFKIPSTGLRFFTVYGPWGRPDMAMFLFAKAISKSQPIKVYNNGQMRRDFTYIDDIVQGIVKVLYAPPESTSTKAGQISHPGRSSAPYKVYNIGNHRSVELLYMIELMEKELGVKAIKEFLPIQPGDVPETYADIDDISADVGFAPQTPIELGIKQFLNWFTEYYKF
jgi:UDP-glucuronate 4-epimerase